MAKISEVGRSKIQDTPPDHGTNTEYDPLLEGQPVEYIKHVGRYVSSSRNAACAKDPRIADRVSECKMREYGLKVNWSGQCESLIVNN